MDWSQSTRDRLAASERQINEARMKREQETRIADRAQRERLEKASPSGAPELELQHYQRRYRADRPQPSFR
jgi:hypothetical protein